MWYYSKWVRNKKTGCIGNVSKNFVTSWNLELTKAEVQLMKILILEHSAIDSPQNFRNRGKF